MPKINNRYKPEESALLVIDITNGCCHQDCEQPENGITFKKIRQMVRRLEKFINQYRNAGGRVVFIKCVPWKKEFLPANINRLYEDPECRYYSENDSGFCEEFYRISPVKGDKVFEKNSYDAFTNPELDEWLKNEEIRHLLISGVFGDGCVHSTINGAFSAQYDLTILEDLIETTDLEIRQNLQSLLKKYTWPMMFGKTVDSTEFF
jgi:nicotinamidase-related amidase